MLILLFLAGGENRIAIDMIQAKMRELLAHAPKRLKEIKWDF